MARKPPARSRSFLEQRVASAVSTAVAFTEALPDKPDDVVAVSLSALERAVASELEHQRVYLDLLRASAQCGFNTLRLIGAKGPWTQEDVDTAVTVLGSALEGVPALLSNVRRVAAERALLILARILDLDAVLEMPEGVPVVRRINSADLAIARAAVREWDARVRQDGAPVV